MNWTRMGIGRSAIAAGALLFVIGCGNGQGTVGGKVTLDGKPLASGFVTIHDSTQQPRTGPITAGGEYSVSNVAPGPAAVTVLTIAKRPSLRDPEAKDAIADPNFVEIPIKYGDKTKSGLSLEVKSGKQDYDIALKSEPKQ